MNFYQILISKIKRYVKLYQLFGWKTTLREICLWLIRKLFVFRIVEFYELQNCKLIIPKLMDGLIFNFVSPDQAKHCPIFKEAKFAQDEIELRYKNGQKCFGAWYCNQLVFFAWVDYNIFKISNVFQLILPSNCAYIGNCFTSPEWRGQSVYPLSLKKLYSILNKNGVDRLFLYIEFENLSSSKSVKKVGFKKVGQCALIGIHNKIIKKITMGQSYLNQLMKTQKVWCNNESCIS